MCFADGSEAIVGVRAEVEKTILKTGLQLDEDREAKEGYGGDDGWVEVGIEVSGQQGKDEEGFWGEMLREGLLGDGKLRERLVINRGWHWRLFIDVGSRESILLNRVDQSIPPNIANSPRFLRSSSFHLRIPIL